MNTKITRQLTFKALFLVFSLICLFGTFNNYVTAQSLEQTCGGAHKGYFCVDGTYRPASEVCNASGQCSFNITKGSARTVNTTTIVSQLSCPTGCSEPTNVPAPNTSDYNGNCSITNNGEYASFNCSFTATDPAKPQCDKCQTNKTRWFCKVDQYSVDGKGVWELGSKFCDSLGVCNISWADTPYTTVVPVSEISGTGCPAGCGTTEDPNLRNDGSCNRGNNGISTVTTCGCLSYCERDEDCATKYCDTSVADLGGVLTGKTCDQSTHTCGDAISEICESPQIVDSLLPPVYKCDGLFDILKKKVAGTCVNYQTNRPIAGYDSNGVPQCSGAIITGNVVVQQCPSGQHKACGINGKCSCIQNTDTGVDGENDDNCSSCQNPASCYIPNWDIIKPGPLSEQSPADLFGTNLCYCPAHCETVTSFEKVNTCTGGQSDALDENKNIITRCSANGLQKLVSQQTCSTLTGYYWESCNANCEVGDVKDCGNGSQSYCLSDGTFSPCRGPCEVNNLENSCYGIGIQKCQPVRTGSSDLAWSSCVIDYSLPAVDFCVPNTVRSCGDAGGMQTCYKFPVTENGNIKGYWGPCTGKCNNGEIKSCFFGTGTQKCIGVANSENTCSSIDRWVDSQSCSGCTAGGYKCSGTNIMQVQNCSKCSVGQSGSAACSNYTTETLATSCGPAQDITTSYCSAGVKCTMRIQNPGTCGVLVAGGVPSCNPLSIDVTCSGACSQSDPVIDENQTHKVCSQQRCVVAAGSGTDQCQSDSDCVQTQCQAGQTLACPQGGQQTCDDVGTFWLPSCQCVNNQPCCSPGSSRTCSTGGFQICNNSGIWEPCPPTNCTPGTTEACDGGGIRKCDLDGKWGPCSCDGSTLCCATGSTENCAGGGEQTCFAQKWGPCKCVDTISCCTPGSTQTCPGGGTQTCNSSGLWDICKCAGSGTCCVPGSTQACLTGGTQTCDLTGKWGSCDCPSGNHFGCFGGSCQCVLGTGSNECQSDSACLSLDQTTHTECNTSKQCVAVSGAGIDQCTIGSDWQCYYTHNECQNSQCKVIQTYGVDLCGGSSGLTCGAALTCNVVTKKCEVGGGGASCSTDTDCTAKRCNTTTQQCTADGTGSLCNITADCSTATHKACVNQKCSSVSGQGVDTCQTDGECSTTHTECNLLKQCVSAAGSGTDQCTIGSDWQCYFTHNECLDFQCKVVQSLGTNLCGADTGLTCEQAKTCNTTTKKCEVGGDGSSCDVDSDCELNACPNCANNACVKNGACDSTGKCVQVNCLAEGQDCVNLCSKDLDCVKHNECSALKKCVSVTGPGADQCYTDTQCTLPAGTNITCDVYNKFTLSHPGKITPFSYAFYTVGRRDINDNLITKGDTFVYLYSSPTTSSTKLYNSSLQKNIIAFTKILDGNSTANFWYYQETPGTYQITVSDNATSPDGAAGMADATDTLSVAYITGITSHTECTDDGTCQTVSGFGVDQCTTSHDCKPPVYLRKNVCNSSQQCVAEDCKRGDPCQDSCESSADCCSAESHSTCVSGKCECVSGVGANECSNDVSCIPATHSTCIGNYCMEVNGEGDSTCQDNSECFVNTEPYTTLFDVGSATPYCSGIPGAGVAVFKWTYNDDQGDTEKKFRIQIDDNSDFSSPEVDRSFDNLSNPSGTINEQTVFVKDMPTIPGGDYIRHNRKYHWRVMLWENSSTVLNSGWTYYDGKNRDGTKDTDHKSEYTFEYLHPAPSALFSFLPESPKPTDLVDFIDSSICYKESGSYLCNQLSNANCSGGKCYTWSFGDGSTSNTIGDTSHTYSALGSNMATLQVCDEIGCCSYGQKITVKTTTGSEVPNYKEIPPF